MLDGGITPRLIVNSLFILGLILAIAFALEFAKCKVSGHKEKRRFNILLCLWFIMVGIYLFVAISFVAGTVSIVFGVFAYFFDKRIANKLL